MIQEQLEYMYNLERFGIKFGLEVMEKLMAELGNPHTKFNSIHITGTNGKGSCAALLESALRANGLRTALYTSPHLFTFNERIQINGIRITDEELSAYIEQVKQATKRANVQPTFFEFTTAIAFAHFAQQSPDLAIIEVGMGGLLDATNVITPKVSVITNIDLDHTELLGSTRQQIAARKAGIIKQGVPVVTGEQDPSILQYLQTVCRERNTHLTVATQVGEVSVKQTSWRGQQVIINDQQYDLPLVGRHQINNLLVVVAVLNCIQQAGWSLTDQATKQGIARTIWRGRLEIVSEKPFIIVDGAHNPQSLAALHDFIIAPETKMPSHDVLVTALKEGKDADILLTKIAPKFQTVIVTEGSYEPMPAQKLAQQLAKYHNSIEVIPNPQQATRRAKELISSEGSLLVTGSLYMIPAALKVLQPDF